MQKCCKTEGRCCKTGPRTLRRKNERCHRGCPRAWKKNYLRMQSNMTSDRRWIVVKAASVCRSKMDHVPHAVCGTRLITMMKTLSRNTRGAEILKKPELEAEDFKASSTRHWSKVNQTLIEKLNRRQDICQANNFYCCTWKDQVYKANNFYWCTWRDQVWYTCWGVRAF